MTLILLLFISFLESRFFFLGWFMVFVGFYRLSIGFPFQFSPRILLQRWFLILSHSHISGVPNNVVKMKHFFLDIRFPQVLLCFRAFVSFLLILLTRHLRVRAFSMQAAHLYMVVMIQKCIQKNLEQ